MRKVLIKDLIIPKGTVFDTAPTKTVRYGDEHIQAVFGLTKDTFGTVEYCFDNCISERQKEVLNEYFADLKE